MIMVMEWICIILVKRFKPSIHAMYVIGTFTEAASLEPQLALLTGGCYAFSNIFHLPISVMEKRKMDGWNTRLRHNTVKVNVWLTLANQVNRTRAVAYSSSSSSSCRHVVDVEDFRAEKRVDV
ncbi:hypothetical protein EmuJ_000917900 [Echinococcus multilocularis]|uniref:Uncharacterized protein n=1 Tax=Echinococcus multilocularis TaxID=6211 RepID=A0A068YE08_ECHMU|nr:hypothetical protein EmuJ_000917900 [Echinococcus multilocularis]